jgi:predicted polyphosphate/ATP-dependent NAD kinase
MMESRRRIGLIVNPLAGLGGRVALKGSDGEGVVAEALRRGAIPLAETRARETLSVLAERRGDIVLLCAPGRMGADSAQSLGFETIVARALSDGPTSAIDTIQAARDIMAAGAELILLAGGDGTARDVLSAVGHSVPILGIPAGVKMQSAVFAVTPRAAGLLAGEWLSDPSRLRIAEAEVLDLDEDAVRAGRIEPKLYGTARVLVERRFMQAPKSRPQPDDDVVLTALAEEIAAELEPGRLYLLGPGTSVRHLKRRLGFEGTLLGVDAVRDGKVAGLDVSEQTILQLAGDGPAAIVLGITGGQGFLLGRGNQQLSAEVLRLVGSENLLILAGPAKIVALGALPLLIDTGDAALDRALAGYRRVRSAPGQTAILKVAAG